MIKHQRLAYLCLLLLPIIYFWDLGNINALRQGTEGFYLEISKEMFRQHSFLTPLFHGQHHWSKPPLHFWLAYFLYSIFGHASLLLGRVVTVLVGLWGIIAFSRWSQRIFKTDIIWGIIFFATSLGILKYSRIYMMEITLTVFTALGSLYFYDYFAQRKKSSLWWASLFLAAGTMIKGPVSLVMGWGGGFLFLLYIYWSSRKLEWKIFLQWVLGSLALASIWFLISYWHYGMEFFNYFFLRENLGKFSSRSYPPRVLFQGLFIYAFPWSIYIFSVLFYWRSRLLEDRRLFFLLINFIVYFALWFIPTQRSHHYAVPSIPFFLLLIWNTFQEKTFRAKFTDYFLGGIFSIFLFIILIGLRLEDYHYTSFVLISAIGLVLIVGTISIFILHRDWPLKIAASFCTLSLFWIFFIPFFYLPLVPVEVVTFLSDKEVATYYRKPYFIEESLHRKLHWITASECAEYPHKHPEQFIIMREARYRQCHLEKKVQIVNSWPNWIKGKKPKEIFNALKSGNIKELQEKMLLIKSVF